MDKRLDCEKRRIDAERIRRWRLHQRQKMITILGGKCVKCGFADIRALQIDHVNGGGCKEFKEDGFVRTNYHNKVMEDKSGSYQLLCANCNWIKRHENDETSNQYAIKHYGNELFEIQDALDKEGIKSQRHILKEGDKRRKNVRKNRKG
jgi:Zn-finger protein